MRAKHTEIRTRDLLRIMTECFMKTTFGGTPCQAYHMKRLVSVTHNIVSVNTRICNSQYCVSAYKDALTQCQTMQKVQRATLKALAGRGWGASARKGAQCTHTHTQC